MTSASARGTVCVVPTISSNVSRVVRQSQMLEAAGARYFAIANGRRAAEALLETDVSVLCPQANLGFGRAVNYAFNEVYDVRWLIVANDDVEIDPDVLKSSIDALETVYGSAPAVVNLISEEHPHPIPGMLDVFLNLSLLGSALRRLRTPSSLPGPRNSVGKRDTYSSFALVAINREAWILVNGFDPSYPFCFEDADFILRARDHLVRIDDYPQQVGHHSHSETTSKFIHKVLPVVTSSALRYAHKWSLARPIVVRLALVLALLLRFPFSLVRRNRRRHVQGICTALAVVCLDVRVELPNYLEI